MKTRISFTSLMKLNFSLNGWASWQTKISQQCKSILLLLLLFLWQNYDLWVLRDFSDNLIGSGEVVALKINQVYLFILMNEWTSECLFASISSFIQLWEKKKRSKKSLMWNEFLSIFCLRENADLVLGYLMSSSLTFLFKYLSKFDRWTRSNIEKSIYFENICLTFSLELN